MDQRNLLFLVRGGESFNVEFKEDFSDSLGKEFCAFANSNGGKILIGVSDRGKITGINVTNRLVSQVHDVATNIDPRLQVFTEKVGDVLVVSVPEGVNKPYSVKGRFYMRRGTNSQQLTRDEIRMFFQKEGLVLFDEKVNPKFKLDVDFSPAAYNHFLEISKVSPVLERNEILENLDLLDDSRIKNAGVLLFSKRVTKFFRNASITCVLFQGRENIKIIDQKEFVGDLYSNYRGAFEYLVSKLNTEYIIKGGGPRDEKLELPERALKEALLNAVGHRNYFSPANIQINIFSDRVEIVNPGGLVPGLKIEELGRKSAPRNTLLFGLMQRMDLVEKAGTGIKRINDAMKAYKLDVPVIEADGDWFIITFRRPNLQTESYESRMSLTRRPTQKPPRNHPETTQIILSSVEKGILEEIRIDKFVSRRVMGKNLDTSPNTIKDCLAKLKKGKILKRVGPDKGGYWEILIKD
ncbi:MAG: putative DNA binding domain-containing protein [Candidatus Altiarchaeota archaeon]|nr:putative DNA binding domain-containing protein [Candidatus Altiarchaeota archaeon]